MLSVLLRPQPRFAGAHDAAQHPSSSGNGETSFKTSRRGGGLLGWIALSMAITDPILYQLPVDFNSKALHILLSSFGAIFVIVTGLILSEKKTKQPSG